MDHRKARSRQGGFTLLEVMIAVAIMASMAAAMTPVWINEYNEGRAKITIEETQSILDAARKFRVQNGTWPGGATCLSAVTALKGTTPPLLAGVTNINKFNQTLSTSCTATTFSIDQAVAADYDGVVANGLANTVVLSSPANSVRTTIGTPGSEPALDSKLSRIAETNAQLNRMETNLLLGGNNITEVGHIDASSLNVSGSTTTGSLGVTGNATVAGTTNTGVLGVTGNALIGGNAGVVGTTTLNGALTANTTSRFNGAADFREIVKLNKVVTEGTACSDTGAIARNSAGLTLSCQSGVWRGGGGTAGELVALCAMCYSRFDGVNNSSNVMMITAYFGKVVLGNNWNEDQNVYELSGWIGGTRVVQSLNANRAYSKSTSISFFVPAGSSYSITSNPPNQSSGPGRFYAYAVY